MSIDSVDRRLEATLNDMALLTECIVAFRRGL
jgi:hypothetical protein